MSRSILVVGNCHIGGIAAALQWLFPSDAISAVPLNPHVFRGDGGAMSRRIAEADVVLGGDFVNVFLRRHRVVLPNFVSIPSLYFAAFHPDITHAGLTTPGRRFPVRNNSAIGLWAFARGIDPADACGLYSRRNFALLGYLDHWDSSVQELRAAFAASRLDFDTFFCAAKREGVFMYTMDHPRISALILVAKLLAMRLGLGAAVWHKDILVSDALGRVEIWPVYPMIAHELALPGSYTWLLDRGRVIDGLREYLEHAYAKYAAAGVRPSDVVLPAPVLEVYDKVLSDQVRLAR